MKRRYPLDAKINALNRIDQLDGDIALTATQLNIPAKTLEKWRAKELDLRRDYQDRQWRRLDRLQFDLNLQMLERCATIMQQMDDSTLSKAPLNQLNATLSALLAHVRKFEETQRNLDWQPEQTIKRAEFYYDDQVQAAPPWAGASPGQPRALQSGGLRPPLGQDRTGQDDHPSRSLDAEQTLLVVDPNAADGEPGLARLEKFYRALEEHPDQRD